MICANCHNPLPDFGDFCPTCGHRAERVVPKAEPSAYEPRLPESCAVPAAAVPDGRERVDPPTYSVPGQGQSAPVRVAPFDAPAGAPTDFPALSRRAAGRRPKRQFCPKCGGPTDGQTGRCPLCQKPRRELPWKRAAVIAAASVLFLAASGLIAADRVEISSLISANSLLKKDKDQAAISNARLSTQLFDMTDRTSDLTAELNRKNNELIDLRDQVNDVRFELELLSDLKARVVSLDLDDDGDTYHEVDCSLVLDGRCLYMDRDLLELKDFKPCELCHLN